MSSFRNQLRPKHQVLVLKCYPKFQKNAADVKPNGSELSYLLYYASTRRSKIQKVGAYLEKKTDGDVRKGKTGNVQVTLQILTALIDRTRRDLTLYAPYVLRILKRILASKDLGLVEDSVATFQAFCEHQDVATFAADQYLVRLYEEVVKTYAGVAEKAKGADKSLSRPASFRWRTTGLKAIRSITRSETIGVDNGQQLRTILPPVLGNVYTESEEYINLLHTKIESPEITERDPTKGRPSIATQRTNETAQTTEGTTEEADRLAEEEVGLLALQCLKQIFSATNRGQVRIATQSLLVYVLKVVKPPTTERPGTAQTTATTSSMLVGEWATAIVKMAARWTPVQDRFIIMVTIMEELVKSPVAEENLEQQLVLVILVNSLLSSSINMIGLSVMDVLLGLIQHILLVLQLGGKGSNILPHHQQTDAIDIFAGEDLTSAVDVSGTVIPANSDEAKDSRRPSTTRKRLLERLRICLGSLANHIYYSDQIADMISAILLRLKPSPLSQVGNPVAAVENPEAAAQAISDSINMQEDPRTDAFFSFGTARVTALFGIKEILTVANSKASVTGAGAVGRNRVGVQIWEGTQWLLRDDDRRVRRAYVDALNTWLKLEMSKNDLSVWEDREARKHKLDLKVSKEPTRAVSSASRRSKTARAPKSTFLQLLHLAIYDNAIETPEDEPEILLLHLLLHHLVGKLGVNSVQHGLPMIIRLQEDINSLDLIGTPKAKIVIGSLVHGYLWTLIDQFDFHSSFVTQEITAEINRRKQHGLWVQGVEMPPVPLEKVMISGAANRIKSVDPVITQTESLRPYDGLGSLVNQISVSYNDSIASPPSSPPGSPGKTFNSPILGNAITHRAQELPDAIREVMLGKWTKASCLASIESELNRTGSIHGSQRGTLRSLKNGFLNTQGASPRDTSPGSDNLPSPSHRSAKKGFGTSLKAATVRTSVPASIGQRKSALHDPRASDSHLDSRNVMRFEDLKRVLDGNTTGRRSSLPSNHDSVDFGAFSSSDRPRASMSADSESMIDAEGLDASDDEATDSKPFRPMSVTSAARQRVGSGGSSSKPTNRTRSSSTASAEDPEANARALKGEIVPVVVRNELGEDPDAVPPVPPLPEGLIGKAMNLPRPATTDFSAMHGEGLGSGMRQGFMADGEARGPADRRSNAQRILSLIEPEEDGVKGLGKPPY